jgi:hypothetical protein
MPCPLPNFANAMCCGMYYVGGIGVVFGSNDDAPFVTCVDIELLRYLVLMLYVLLNL